MAGALSACPSGYAQLVNPTTGLPTCVPQWIECPKGYFPAGSDAAGWKCALVPTGGAPSGPAIVPVAEKVPALSDGALLLLALALAWAAVRRLSV